MVRIGEKVRFRFRAAITEGAHQKPEVIKTGKIKEQMRSGSFLIQIIEPDGKHSQNGTICNRLANEITESAGIFVAR